MATHPTTLPQQSSTDWVVPVATVILVFVMIVPVPALLLDLLLATSITLGVVVLLASLYILRPAQFSVFPTLLLFLTLFRISLNIASSRRILLHGNEGATAAGSVIASFGQFVVGGNYVVGFVLFIALIAIQYLVINHGAVRTAEVAARFTLDALPGKQMAIDADMNAGTIDEREARARRAQIAQEAEFYGAMDGAARFSQRDALATILITAINILAGFLIGVFQLNIPFQDALKTYTILTVGDGLVTMIPSLLVSVAGGLVVTRASSDKTVGVDLVRQLFSKKWPLRIASGVMFMLALIPGLPKFSFLLAASVVAWLASRATDTGAVGSDATPAAPEKSKEATQQQQLESVLRLDDIHLEVGYALVPLVDQAHGGQLLQRIRALRRHLASQLGFLVPSVHITDNIRLKPREYVVELRGVEVARSEMQQDRLLAISSDPNASPLEGIDTREPAFGVAAKWIDFDHCDASRGNRAPECARTAHTAGNQAPPGCPCRDAPQTRGGTCSAFADARGIAEGAAAIASRTSFHSGPSRHSRNAARYSAGQQEPSSSGRNGASGVGPFAGDAAAGHRSQTESAHPGSHDRRGNRPKHRGAGCRRAGRFAGSAIVAPGARRPAKISG